MAIKAKRFARRCFIFLLYNIENEPKPTSPFSLRNSGLIEDQSTEALEVDLENKFIGGGPLDRGCVSWKTLVLRLSTQ
ncbi:hypothetical protein ACB092_04G004000 [Castanea dentata]